ncbi:hypothetical protein BSKO_03407 [Bryopsis sp. KO-2023]|nr:hypothetical protein BSKO_03407 [Bryopsis sp. KO-2023]
MNDIEGGLRIGPDALLVFKNIIFKNFGTYRIGCDGLQPFFPFFSFDEDNSSLDLEGVHLAYESQFCSRPGETLPALGIIQSYGEAATIHTSFDLETNGTMIEYGSASGHRCFPGIIQPLQGAPECVQKGVIHLELVRIYCSPQSVGGLGTAQSRIREVMDAEQLLMQVTSSSADVIRLLVPTKLYRTSRPSGGIGVRRYLTVDSESSVDWIIEGSELLLLVLPGAHLKIRQLRISVEGNASFSTMGVGNCPSGIDYLEYNSLLILGGVVTPGSWAQLSFEGVHINYEVCISDGIDLDHYVAHLQSLANFEGSVEAKGPYELKIEKYEVNFPIYLGGSYTVLMTGSTRINLSNSTITCNRIEARLESVDPAIIDQGGSDSIPTSAGPTPFPLNKLIILCAVVAGSAFWIAGASYCGLRKARSVGT